MGSPDRTQVPEDVAKRNAVSSRFRGLVRELMQSRGVKMGGVYAITNDVSAFLQTDGRMFQLCSDSTQYIGGDEIPATLKELNPELFHQMRHWSREQRPSVGQEDAAVIREIPIPSPVSATQLRVILEREIPLPRSWN